MNTSDERAVDDAADAPAVDRSSLVCLFADFVSAPRSTWFARVVDARSSHQDRNRPYVTRLVLLVALIVASAAVGFPWFGWLFFIPGALQVALEKVSLAGVVPVSFAEASVGSTRASLEADATPFAEVAADGGAVRVSLEADALTVC